MKNREVMHKFVMNYDENHMKSREVIADNIDVLDDPYRKYGTIVKGRDLEKFSLPLDGFAVVCNRTLPRDMFPFAFVLQHLHDFNNKQKVNQSLDMWEIESNGKDDDVTTKVTGRWMSKMDRNFTDEELKSKVIDFFSC